MREVAYKVITDVEEKNSFVNLALKDIQVANMPQVTIRVYGYLQYKLYLEYLANEITEKKKMDLVTRRIIQMAIYEKLFLDSVPDYAIVNEYSKLCRKYNRDALSFVSYILNNKIGDLTRIMPTFANEIKNISIRYSYPQAMLKVLMKQYPNDYLKIVESTLMQKRITGRYLNQVAKQPYFFDDFTICNVSDEDFKNKELVIQDLGSYLIVKYLSPSGDVLDLCAAPGIKTMHIAKTANNVVANEINISRVNKLKTNLDTYKIDNVKVINCDASNKDELLEKLNSQKFDKILVDAPCSGSGVFGSKPDLKYRQNMNEINSIIELQTKILKTALEFLKPDGKIIYSTCSLNKNENEEVVLKIIEEFNLSFVEDDEIAKFALKNKVGYTILPYTNHSDGFYMCKLRRK